MSQPWHPEDLAAIATAEELHLSTRRADGSLSPPVTIWGVALHGVVIVRSAYGPDNGWYRRALARGAGRLRAGGVDRGVVLQPGDHFDQALVDDEYRRKYARHAASIVGTVAGDHAHGVSIIVTPER